MAKLALHAFPGNVRELRNVIQRALFLRDGPAIMPEHIVFDAPYRTKAPASTSEDDVYLHLPGKSLQECTEEIIWRSVRRNGDKTASAEELGISRTTIVKVCKRWDGSLPAAAAP
jgi:transcriptional regulator with PAS, ATPase and Fis domain